VELIPTIWIFQIINFILFCFIVKRFLFKPVTHVLDQRRTAMRDQVDSCERAEREAQEMMESLRVERSALQEERLRILSHARQEAEELTDRTRAELQKEISEERQNIQDQIGMERERATGELAEELAGIITDFSKEILKGLIHPFWQKSFLMEFTRILDQLQPHEVEDLKEAILAQQGRIHIRSAFPIDHPEREEILKQLRTAIEMEVDVAWQEDASLLCGIEVQAGGLALDVHLKNRLAQGSRQMLDGFRPGSPRGIHD